MRGGQGAKPSYLVRRATLDDVAGIATVHVQSWLTSYRGLLPQDFLTSLTVEGRIAAWKHNLSEPRHVVFVGTTTDGRIVGFCSAGPNRDEPRSFDGEVYAIYLLEEVTRQGLGGALLAEAATWLWQSGMSSFLVWVLTGTLAARKFYEALGGEAVAEKVISIAGSPYNESAYGWTCRAVTSSSAASSTLARG
jgi:GNAT superfamily N-acetyltransferase